MGWKLISVLDNIPKETSGKFIHFKDDKGAGAEDGSTKERVENIVLETFIALAKKKRKHYKREDGKTNKEREW